jgi:hypothetical protein
LELVNQHFYQIPVDQLYLYEWHTALTLNCVIENIVFLLLIMELMLLQFVPLAAINSFTLALNGPS